MIRGELFEKLCAVCALDAGKTVLEIGPGTGQATEPVLRTGCDYTAIELGEHFTEFMERKFGNYPNFHIINADFEVYGFPENQYDLVFSAATIQWIPEEIAFTKTFQMLKPGGHLAMFMTRSDERSANGELYERTLTADEYVSYISTHCEHITLEEPYRSVFYEKIREVVRENGDQVKILDTIPLYLVQKP